MDITGALFFNARPVFLGPDTDDGGAIAPLADGFIYFYLAGTSTPEDVFADTDLSTPLSNPVELDADGRPPAIYLSPVSYKVVVTDRDLVTVYTLDGYRDVSQVVLATLGAALGEGAADVTSGYAVLQADHTIEVASTGGPNPCVVNLQPAGERTWPLCIINKGTVALAVTPDGAETINGIAGAFTIPAAASPVFPSAVFMPRSSSNYVLQASHKIP